MFLLREAAGLSYDEIAVACGDKKVGSQCPGVTEVRASADAAEVLFGVRPLLGADARDEPPVLNTAMAGRVDQEHV